MTFIKMIGTSKPQIQPLDPLSRPRNDGPSTHKMIKVDKDQEHRAMLLLKRFTSRAAQCGYRTNWSCCMIFKVIGRYAR